MSGEFNSLVSVSDREWDEMEKLIRDDDEQVGVMNMRGGGRDSR
jgi:hypothetical protein